MDHFGLTLKVSKHLPGAYKEFIYETSENGGIMAWYRLDNAPKMEMNIGHVEKSNVPLDQVPRVIEADNVLYSIGMNSELFNSIMAHLQR
jgi:hypothetical protein